MSDVINPNNLVTGSQAISGTAAEMPNPWDAFDITRIQAQLDQIVIHNA